MCDVCVCSLLSVCVAFALSPLPPTAGRKGAFDYSRWDKIVDDIEKRDQVRERYDQLQKNPQYEWRDGQKMQVIF